MQLAHAGGGVHPEKQKGGAFVPRRESVAVAAQRKFPERLGRYR